MKFLVGQILDGERVYVSSDTIEKIEIKESAAVVTLKGSNVVFLKELYIEPSYTWETK